MYKDVVCYFDNRKGRLSCVGVGCLYALALKLVFIQIRLFQLYDIIYNPQDNHKVNIYRVYIKGNEKEIKIYHCKNEHKRS